MNNLKVNDIDSATTEALDSDQQRVELLSSRLAGFKRLVEVLQERLFDACAERDWWRSRNSITDAAVATRNAPFPFDYKIVSASETDFKVPLKPNRAYANWIKRDSGQKDEKRELASSLDHEFLLRQLRDQKVLVSSLEETVHLLNKQLENERNKFSNALVDLAFNNGCRHMTNNVYSNYVSATDSSDGTQGIHDTQGEKMLSQETPLCNGSKSRRRSRCRLSTTSVGSNRCTDKSCKSSKVQEILVKEAMRKVSLFLTSSAHWRMEATCAMKILGDENAKLHRELATAEAARRSLSRELESVRARAKVAKRISEDQISGYMRRCTFLSEALARLACIADDDIDRKDIQVPKAMHDSVVRKDDEKTSCEEERLIRLQMKRRQAAEILVDQIRALQKMLEETRKLFTNKIFIDVPTAIVRVCDQFAREKMKCIDQTEDTCVDEVDNMIKCEGLGKHEEEEEGNGPIADLDDGYCNEAYDRCPSSGTEGDQYCCSDDQLDLEGDTQGCKTGRDTVSSGDPTDVEEGNDESEKQKTIRARESGSARASSDRKVELEDGSLDENVGDDGIENRPSLDQKILDSKMKVVTNVLSNTSGHEIMINVDVGQSDRIQDLAWKLAKAKMEATVLHSHDADLVAAARAETRFYRSIFCRGLHQICAGDVSFAEIEEVFSQALQE